MLVFWVAAIAVIIIFALAVYIIILKEKINRLSKRRVDASPGLIEMVEKEMLRALRYHNTDRYSYYRAVFNDLNPKVEQENSKYMY